MDGFLRGHFEFPDLDLGGGGEVFSELRCDGFGLLWGVDGEDEMGEV